LNNENENIDVSNLELAPQKKRLYAFVIDDILITFLTLFLLWDSIASVQGDYASILLIMNAAFVQIILLKVVYQSLFIWYYGATLGKMLAKVKVIDFENFGKITFAQSVLRASTRIVSESVFYIGFLLAYYTQSKQTLHDKISKTLVVNV